MTFQESNYLLSLRKYVCSGDTICESYQINPEHTEARIILKSETASDGHVYFFLLVIRRGRKSRIQVTFHLQDDATSLCLLRLDFNGPPHTNPVMVLDSVPQIFRDYAGKIIKESHIHYHIEGYKTGKWALPISALNFSPIVISDNDFSTTFVEAVIYFCTLINIQTTITFSPEQRLFD